MNRQELIEEINQLPTVLDRLRYGSKVMVAKDSVMELVRQFGRTSEDRHPAFVAEWIEYVRRDSRKNFRTLRVAINHLFIDYPDNERICEWGEEAANQELLARALLDGYEVEREEVSSNQVPTVFDKETLKKMVLDAAMWHLHCGNHKWSIDDMLKQIDKAFEEGGGTR